MARRKSYQRSLSGKNLPDGYAVYKIREIAYGGATKLSAEDGFLQFMMERLFSSNAPITRRWKRKTLNLVMI